MDDTKIITIVTHDGTFHCDEITAYTILSKVYKDINLIRTRNDEIINNSDIVIDVGKTYNDLDRFDHHQDNCNEFFNNNYKILLSSAGMVYKKYGKMLINNILNKESKHINKLYKIIYDEFIMEIDAIDNGISQYDNNIRSNYRINSNISTLVAKMNNEDSFDYDKQMSSFLNASDMILNILTILVNYHENKEEAYDNDYKTISFAMEERFTNSKFGEFIIIKENCNNWFKCIIDYEKRNIYKKGEKQLKYIIYPSNNEWRIKTISFKFKARKNLLSYDELKKKVRNPDNLKFVHKALFIGSAKDLITAIEMATISLYFLEKSIVKNPRETQVKLC
jgi:uncharacterized UPF0160 family protein